jgi:hypothetical protein
MKHKGQITTFAERVSIAEGVEAGQGKPRHCGGTGLAISNGTEVAAKLLPKISYRVTSPIMNTTL